MKLNMIHCSSFCLISFCWNTDTIDPIKERNLYSEKLELKCFIFRLEMQLVGEHVQDPGFDPQYEVGGNFQVYLN